MDLTELKRKLLYPVVSFMASLCYAMNIQFVLVFPDNIYGDFISPDYESTCYITVVLLRIEPPAPIKLSKV